MDIIALILGLGWILFFLYWIIIGAQSKRTIRNNTWWKRVAFRVVVIVLIVWLIDSASASGHFLTIFSQPATYFSLAWGIIGLVIWAIGIALAVWARVYLGKNWGMPMSLKENPELVTEGPYRYVRHPIYSGILLGMIGSIFANGTWWIVSFVIFGIYFIYSAIKEDDIMARQFPEQYPAYKKRTKMIVPFLL